MELVRDNVSSAADPTAITVGPAPKQPIWNNDPTKEISPRQSVDRMITVTLSVLAFVILAVASVLTMVRR